MQIGGGLDFTQAGVAGRPVTTRYTHIHHITTAAFVVSQWCVNGEPLLGSFSAMDLFARVGLHGWLAVLLCEGSMGILINHRVAG